MGIDSDEHYTEYPEFSDALRRLGWLSSYSRQIILSRHMLRCFQDEEVSDQMLWSGSKQTALNCFRVAITALSGINAEQQPFSAPYEPQDRPETFYLAFNRKEKIFEVSIASALPSIAFYSPSGSSFGFENSTVGAEEDMQLIQEINEISKGVSLSTKSIGDDRASLFRNEPLWGKTGYSDWSSTDRFLDEWLPEEPKAADFWRRWIWGFLIGTPIAWKLQARIARIPDDDWEKGPIHLAEVIARIEAQLTGKAEPKPPSKAQSNAFANRANENVEAISLSVASLAEQLSIYREAVRGDNQSDPVERQTLIDFLDRLNGSLRQLLDLLPKQGEKLPRDGGSALVLWWREYRSLVPKEVAKYTSPTNVTTATIPTSMILGGMAIGTLVGGPAGAGVGAIVGGLLTNQVKPGQAADQLTKPYEGGSDEF